MNILIYSLAVLLACYMLMLCWRLICWVFRRLIPKNKVGVKLPGYASFRPTIAVFGASASGKTLLLASFYGHHQSQDFRQSNRYSLSAANDDQGARLLSAYFKIRKCELPHGTRFNYHEYDFHLMLEGFLNPAATVRWYDYPGEWLEGALQSQADEKKRLDLFVKLMNSDVALLLIDGSLFKQDGSDYIRWLFDTFKNQIINLRLKLSENHNADKFKKIPSIWVIALSKADLLPDYTAELFKEEIMTSAVEQLIDLRRCIKELLQLKNSEVSLGEEFLLLSSANFDATGTRVVDPKRTMGIGLISAIVSVAPIKHIISRSPIGKALRTIGPFVKIAFDTWKPKNRELASVVSAVEQLSSQAAVDSLAELDYRARKRKEIVAASLIAMVKVLQSQNAIREYHGIRLERHAKL